MNNDITEHVAWSRTARRAMRARGELRLERSKALGEPLYV